MRGDIRPVILCGGSGARLWPVSTPARPKPFHRLTGRETLLQQTARRFSGPGFSAPIVVCAAAHAGLVRRQMKAAGLPVDLLVVEAEPRGTAVAAALGALAAEEMEPGARILIAPADHAVANAEALRACVAEGAAIDDRIVLFGACPDCIETGYGYIQPGADDTVVAFVEKPEASEAATLISDGCLWNTGMFLTPAALLLSEVANHAPEISDAARRSWMAGIGTTGRRAVAVSPLSRATPASLDHAVIERSDRLAVVPCDIGWRDVGCWRSVWSGRGRDPADNSLNGPATVVESSGCLVWSSGAPVAVIGLSDIVVVSTDDGVLVMPRERAQDVRRLTP